MKETTLTIEQIETILTGYPDSPYFIRQNIVIPNCSWGFLNHEADLLILNKSKHLIEIEIKRTWSDFMGDFKKDHTHNDKKLSRLYYAVPLSIAERVFNHLYVGTYKCKHDYLYYEHSEVLGYTENNPNRCGMIIYASQNESLVRGNRIGSCCVNVLAHKISDYKVTTDEELKLLRLLGLRVWNLKKKMANLQQKIKQK